MKEGRSKRGTGYLARIRLQPGQVPEVEACPYELDDHRVRPLASLQRHDEREKLFLESLRILSKVVGGVGVGNRSEDGCYLLDEPGGS